MSFARIYMRSNSVAPRCMCDQTWLLDQSTWLDPNIIIWPRYMRDWTWFLGQSIWLDPNIIILRDVYVTKLGCLAKVLGWVQILAKTYVTELGCLAKVLGWVQTLSFGQDIYIYLCVCVCVLFLSQDICVTELGC